MKKLVTLSVLYCASCCAQLSPNQAGKFLDKNYVKAKIYTANDKFWNLYGNQLAAYEVPKGSNKKAIAGNSIWIGGLDKGGMLHVAANTYRQNGADFWPGPLDTTNISTFNTTNSTPYNNLWKLDCDTISNFITAFNNGSVANNTYQIPQDILNYPAKGIANFQKNLCPFVDVNNNGLYNPQSEGDYPLIKGNQQILSIFNDANGIHTESGGASMGVEIQERSYAYFDPTLVDSMQAINYTTFYHYNINNRSNESYSNVYITVWSDVEIGYYLDDYVGTDTLNNFAYGYNATAIDPTSGPIVGYGNKPPVISHAILKTNCSSDGIDNNNNGVIDETGEQFGLNRVTYYNNNYNAFPPPTTNPSGATQYYNYMSGLWKNGAPFTYGGTAYGGNTPTNFIYTGNPATNTGWTESSANNSPGDRRLLLSSGPFTFPAGAKTEWAFAIVFSQDTSVVGNTINQFNTRVRRDVRNARYYDETNSGMLCASAINVGIKNNVINHSDVLIYPNPASGLTSIELSENIQTASVKLLTLLGKTVLQTEIKDSYRSQLDLSSLENGIYFIEISAGNKRLTKKVVKN